MQEKTKSVPADFEFSKYKLCFKTSMKEEPFQKS